MRKIPCKYFQKKKSKFYEPRSKNDLPKEEQFGFCRWIQFNMPAIFYAHGDKMITQRMCSNCSQYTQGE